ncbi:hypothetical protein MBLNU230_g4220t1 [Neophaeotheca triangularis]
MAKKRTKKRTHVGAPGKVPAPGRMPAPGNAPSKPGDRTPKSMVIRVGAGDVGPSVSQLVKDVRSMMEPSTATRLRERKSNKLRDFTSMAGPLGVSHLLLFSRSSSGNTNLRLALTPRGPTFHFRVEKYSLCKDVHKSMKRPKTGGSEYLHPPLLVMNNFSSQAQDDTKDSEKAQPPQIPKHLESLTTTVFQSLFPPINPTATPLKSIKRIMLCDRAPSVPTADSANYVLNLRHYAIETRTAKSVPKALRKLDQADKTTRSGVKRKKGSFPNLGKLNDVSDYLLDPHAADGFTSGSESEPETDAEVEVLHTSAQRTQRKKAQQEQQQQGASDRRDPAARTRVERKGIKLHELGPRLRLRLTKVEEGLCGGKVMWHEYIHKSKEELKAMDKAHEKRRQEKEARKAEQRANVERKRAERKSRGEPEVQSGDEEDEEDMDDDDDEWDDDEFEGEDGDVEAGADDEEMQE